MKSFFTYLSLSILLLICYLEKQWAGAARRQGLPEKVGDHRFLVRQFAANDGVSGFTPFQMRTKVSDVVGGSYRIANSTTDMDLTGTASSQNELILTDPRNVTSTGMSFDDLQKTGNSLIWISGLSSLHGRDNHYPFLGHKFR